MGRISHHGSLLITNTYLKYIKHSKINPREADLTRGEGQILFFLLLVLIFHNGAALSRTAVCGFPAHDANTGLQNANINLVPASVEDLSCSNN